MVLPLSGAHSQAREADCEPANRACVTTTPTQRLLSIKLGLQGPPVRPIA
jgi:hypothetical protein